nr:hypothetical protein CFP56_40852 [Quercus suber]
MISIFLIVLNDGVRRLFLFSSSRWVFHLHTNSSKTPGPVLISSTSVFLMQSNQGKFRTHFGHGSAALTKIHERTGPTVLYRGHHQLRGAGSNGPAPWRQSKKQKTRSHIESLSGVRIPVAGGIRKSKARTFLFSEDKRQCPNKLEKPRDVATFYEMLQTMQREQLELVENSYEMLQTMQLKDSISKQKENAVSDKEIGSTANNQQSIVRWPPYPINSVLARIRAQIEKNKEKGSSSHQEAPGFGGANVDLDAEIDRMVEEGAPPLFDMPDIQAKFEELLIQIASGFSHMDSLFVDMYTDLMVLTRVDRIEQFLHVLSPPPPSPPIED